MYLRAITFWIFFQMNTATVKSPIQTPQRFLADTLGASATVTIPNILIPVNRHLREDGTTNMMVARKVPGRVARPVRIKLFLTKVRTCFSKAFTIFLFKASGVGLGEQ